MTDERATDDPTEPDDDAEELVPPDPRRDPAGALDALEQRVLGAPRDRFDEASAEEDSDEPGEDKPGPRPDEPPS